MAIIYSYPYDQIVTDTDAWVGTDSINRQTKQYTAKAVADYLNINGRIAIAGQMNYQFVEDPSFKAGTFAFPAGQGDNTPWSSITSVVISNMDSIRSDCFTFLGVFNRRTSNVPRCSR